MNKEIKSREDLVLIVDDIKENYEILSTFLEDVNVKSEWAYNGADAVKMYSEKGQDYYSLILMDIHMPVMDGFEAAKKIRELGAKIPILAVTASSRDDDRFYGAENIFNSSIFKPFKYISFYNAVFPFMINEPAYPERLLEKMNPRKGLMPEKHVCHIDKGVENLGNNRRLFIKSYNNFKKNNMTLALRLKNLICEGHSDKAAIMCHSTKGLCGMLAMTDLETHISELEELIENCPCTDDLPEMADPLLSTISNDLKMICQVNF